MLTLSADGARTLAINRQPVDTVSLQAQQVSRTAAIAVNFERAQTCAGAYQIRDVLVGSKAEAAGLPAGGCLRAVDSETVGEWERSDLYDRLRGPVGAPLTLTLDQERTFTVSREEVSRSMFEQLEAQVNEQRERVLQEYSEQVRRDLAEERAAVQRQQVAADRQRVAAVLDEVDQALRGAAEHFEPLLGSVEYRLGEGARRWPTNDRFELIRGTPFRSPDLQDHFSGRSRLDMKTDLLQEAVEEQLKARFGDKGWNIKPSPTID